MLLHDCNLLSDEGKWWSVKLMVALARCEEVESRLTTVGSGQWRLVLVEASKEEGRRAGEGWLRCGMLQGSRCPFIGAGRGAQAVG
jgi:hypothetical protein